MSWTKSRTWAPSAPLIVQSIPTTEQSYVVGGMYAPPQQKSARDYQAQSHASVYDSPPLTRDDIDRANQTAHAQRLQDVMAGQGSSVAQEQLGWGLGAAQKQAMGLAASNPGISPALASRIAGQQQAGLATQYQGQLGQLRAQEQAQARQEYAGLIHGMRGQDIGLATSQAQLGQQASATNLAAQMQQQAQIDLMTRYYTDLGYDVEEARRAAEMQVRAQELQKYSVDMGVASAMESAAATRRGQNMQLVGASFDTTATLTGAAATTPPVPEPPPPVPVPLEPVPNH